MTPFLAFCLFVLVTTTLYALVMASGLVKEYDDEET